jgi:hypothetical protein
MAAFPVLRTNQMCGLCEERGLQHQVSPATQPFLFRLGQHLDHAKYPALVRDRVHFGRLVERLEVRFRAPSRFLKPENSASLFWRRDLR